MTREIGSSERQPTPAGWSDTDWIKHLQYHEENPMACLHINQGSFDAAAYAYEDEYNNARLIASAPRLLDALKAARRELHACQAVIHLSGGFDQAYVSGAKEALKEIDDAIA